MDISIIILNYKTPGLLKQAIRGIQNERLALDHEVIVVDNNSSDGSVAMVRENFPQVQLIASPTNVGFSAGNNLGIAAAKGKYILIMNTDVALFAGAVTALYQYLETNAHVGMAVPKLINPDGTPQHSTYLFPSFLVAALRRTPLGKFPWSKKVLRKFLMSDWDRQDTRAVGWALGACLLIRTDALRTIGGFDERFFLYVEDTDLCRQFWRAGHQVYFVHTAEMVHYHQRQSAENPGLGGIFSYPTRVHIRSWLKYFKKYRGQPKPPHSL